MKHLLYLGVLDTSYPRNQRIRCYFEDRLQWTVHSITIDDRPGYLRKSLNLLRSGLAHKGPGVDLILLAEFSLKYLPVALTLRILMNSRLAIDWFVGLYETRVQDVGGATPVQAIATKALDILAAIFGNPLLTDTDSRAEMLKRKYYARTTPIVLPVGASSIYSHDVGAPTSGRWTILYYGNYIPLHGLDWVLDALAQLPLELDWQVRFVGNGLERARIENRVRGARYSERCTFHEPVSENQLVRYISESSIVLGIFGDSPKARSVIANKVWQGLAAGRPVLTRRTSALSEIEPSAEGFLIQVSSPQDLAQRLIGLISNPSYWSTERVKLARTIGPRLEDYVNDRYTALRLALDTAGEP
ncbi:Glycosyltransferase involved in cell wall bisynthesis [Quadrisphaera granulorum]|uniref:Glycosyltransferase involved in cell wall biosynthesis n=1 Tax=Quadrisphaera granulorum TaxID=317664 RepID=A0A315ZJZ1_9ACTN|nr:glycosyltransferase [Quadrisphaera granulorum]PWJ45806.1 glycosyltransferase involved in cell wall biosynthesis [Quadrisphaera granulorum]SZE99111.1 Glycosyltransferase involved in cell wall bisynthesis [Quadrisphaera granulorum]